MREHGDDDGDDDDLLVRTGVLFFWAPSRPSSLPPPPLSPLTLCAAGDEGPGEARLGKDMGGRRDWHGFGVLRKACGLIGSTQLRFYDLPHKRARATTDKVDTQISTYLA